MAELITISAAPDWWLLLGDPGKWSRRPLVAWAMVADGGAPFTVGMVVGPDGEEVELAEPGTYVHVVEFVACLCERPATSDVDHRFCSHCAGLVDR